MNIDSPSGPYFRKAGFIGAGVIESAPAAKGVFIRLLEIIPAEVVLFQWDNSGVSAVLRRNGPCFDGVRAF